MLGRPIPAGCAGTERVRTARGGGTARTVGASHHDTRVRLTRAKAPAVSCSSYSSKSKSTSNTTTIQGTAGTTATATAPATAPAKNPTTADAADAADADAAAVTTTTPFSPSPSSSRAPSSPMTPLPTPLPAVPYADVVLLQAFGWDSHRQRDPSYWRRVADDLAPRFAATLPGVTHAWLPPPSASVAPEGYLPGQLYDVDGSAYGTHKDLRDACAALLSHGVTPVADIVVNHRCADRTDQEGRWNQYDDTREEEDDETGGEQTDNRPRGRAIDWGRWAITADDPHFGGEGNPDSGADFDGAPDLDHHNPQLRDALVDWLSWLRDEFGFAGWRLDYAKGYAAKYAGEYIARSLPRGSFCVGELWCDLKWGSDGKPEINQDEARQALCDWVDGARAGGREAAAAAEQATDDPSSSASADAVPGDTAAFCFVTKGVLQAALASGELWRLRDAHGKAPGMAGYWPQRAVLFVDNHDTGSSQQHWPCPANCLQAAYAYVLTHPGIPCLFGEHVFGRDCGGNNDDSPLRRAIEALLRARCDAGVSADSALEILRAEQDLYVADVVSSRGGEGGPRRRRLRVKLGSAMDMGGLLPKEEEGWALEASGDKFAVWSRDEEEENS